jgi:hypothetical protein
MTIDEVIKRYNDNAKYERTHGNLQGCLDFKQLAEWLRDYKRLKEQSNVPDINDGDIISRQAVLDGIDAKAWEFCDYLISKGRNDEQKPVSHFADNLREFVSEELPSVKPQTGHWEWVQYDSNPNIGNWHCSECRTIIPHMPEETDSTPIYKWCPICGARMESEQNG